MKQAAILQFLGKGFSSRRIELSDIITDAFQILFRVIGDETIKRGIEFGGTLLLEFQKPDGFLHRGVTIFVTAGFYRHVDKLPDRFFSGLQCRSCRLLQLRQRYQRPRGLPILPLQTLESLNSMQVRSSQRPNFVPTSENFPATRKSSAVWSAMEAWFSASIAAIMT